VKCRKYSDDIESGGNIALREAAWQVPVYGPGGVRHEDGVSPACGFCTEREKADVDAVVLCDVRSWRKGACRGETEGTEYR
jgi:hypothetical protein